MTTLTSLEILSSVAPLGLRFWDAVTNSFVGSGLMVTAYPVGQDHRSVTAIANRTGVYAFHHLPGLRELENGAGDDAYWANLSATRRFRIQVDDLESRFLPCSFTVEAPARGVMGLVCGSPLLPFSFASPLSPAAPALEAVPLFSAPNRAVPPGMAVIRAHLWDSVAMGDAAGALVEAHPAGQAPVRGIADEKGALTLLFPYPMPQPSLTVASPESPLGLGRQPLWEQSWRVPLRAFYAALDPSATELCDILTQPAATLWFSQSPDEALVEATLRYGQEVILRSAGGNVPASSVPISTGAPP
jgi:hypothetical protein